MLSFRCTKCQSTVFFENERCGACGAALGFVAQTRQMVAFSVPADAPNNTDMQAPWTPLNVAGITALRPCANRVQHRVCNWMLDPGDPVALCRSCRLTRVIPSLDRHDNLARWLKIEQAKRRLVFTLLALNLVPEPKTGPDDMTGLDFHLLDTLAGEAAVKTGHDRGTITLNITEADDDTREAIRVHLGEPVRTLLGHLRHEVSHYLQYRWVTDAASLERSRAVFGDERDDYAAALKRHYDTGPPADWPIRFVSAYASVHPWEDWAETCAHYLLVLDAVQTATAWGLSLQGGAVDVVSSAGELLAQPPIAHLAIAQWLPLAQFLNAMNRSLGLRDAYPFLLPPAVVDKMALVQSLLTRGSLPDRSMDYS
jgi:hypothetical protein